MAVVKESKANKDYICSKCKNIIKPKETYKRIRRLRQPDQIVCCNCKIRGSELTNSEYIGAISDLIEDLDVYSIDDIDNLINELENIRDNEQDKLDNMPDSLQYSPTGEIIQTRIDNTENAIDELETVKSEIEEQFNSIEDILSNLNE